MKTNLPEQLTTAQEATTFLTELVINYEAYNPKLDAHIVKDSEGNALFNIVESDAMNVRMKQCIDLLPNINKILFDLKIAQVRQKADAEREESIKQAKNICERDYPDVITTMDHTFRRIAILKEDEIEEYKHFLPENIYNLIRIYLSKRYEISPEKGDTKFDTFEYTRVYYFNDLEGMVLSHLLEITGCDQDTLEEFRILFDNLDIEFTE